MVPSPRSIARPRWVDRTSTSNSQNSNPDRSASVAGPSSSTVSLTTYDSPSAGSPSNGLWIPIHLPDQCITCVYRSTSLGCSICHNIHSRSTLPKGAPTGMRRPSGGRSPTDRRFHIAASGLFGDICRIVAVHQSPSSGPLSGVFGRIRDAGSDRGVFGRRWGSRTTRCRCHDG